MMYSDDTSHESCLNVQIRAKMVFLWHKYVENGIDDCDTYERKPKHEIRRRICVKHKTNYVIDTFQVLVLIKNK